MKQRYLQVILFIMCDEKKKCIFVSKINEHGVCSASLLSGACLFCLPHSGHSGHSGHALTEWGMRQKTRSFFCGLKYSLYFYILSEFLCKYKLIRMPDGSTRKLLLR